MTERTPRLASTLQEDHDRLGTLFEEFRASRAASPERRAELFRPFAAGLRAHIRFEEETAFPLYGQGDPACDSTRTLLLDEHRRIQEVLERIEDRLAVGPADTAALEEALLNVLWAHDAREEGQVYPWFDAHLPTPRIEELVAVFRRLEPQGDRD